MKIALVKKRQCGIFTYFSLLGGVKDEPEFAKLD